MKMHPISPKQFTEFNRKLDSLGVNTVCNSALCINRPECFRKEKAAFLIMGNTCTRNCRFCGINSGKPEPIDSLEPQKIAKAVKLLGLKYAVVTSVTRDDLQDRGAGHFERTVKEVRKFNPNVKIELLIPDFSGKKELIQKIVDCGPDVINHNIECARSCFRKIRPKGNYELSLNLLNEIKKINPEMTIKSGFMVGVGESMKDIEETLEDLKKSRVDIITVGQYLAPKKSSYEIRKLYNEEEFSRIREYAGALKFKHVFVGANVRSSYNAEEQMT